VARRRWWVYRNPVSAKRIPRDVSTVVAWGVRSSPTSAYTLSFCHCRLCCSFICPRNWLRIGLLSPGLTWFSQSAWMACDRSSCGRSSQDAVDLKMSRPATNADLLSPWLENQAVAYEEFPTTGDCNACMLYQMQHCHHTHTGVGTAAWCLSVWCHHSPTPNILQHKVVKIKKWPKRTFI